MENRLLKAVEFIPLVVIGVPGNVYIVIRFAFMRIMEKKLLPTNIILMVLAFVNLLLLLTRAIPQYIFSMGLEYLLDDSNCKFFVYTYRVCRGMSISYTSLLSCHQCILIAPTTKLWVYLKQRVSQNILVIIIVILFINLLLYASGILHAHAKTNSTTSPYTMHLVTCTTDFLSFISYIMNGTLLVLKDFILVGLMTVASSYIVNVLLRHELTIKGIRSSDNVKGKSIEQKASRSVIMLVVLYVVLFGLDNSTWIYSMFNSKPDLNDARIVLACSYSALSPVVIIATNPKLQHRANISQWRMMLSKSHQVDSASNVNCISQNRNGK